MSHSYITVIPKPGKDSSECANYRPIALLNSDLKVFTKSLANRLNLWLLDLIHKDQVGFVLCRQGGDNTRRARDLIDVINQQNEEALLLSLDAGKAFDRLDWSFMAETLRTFGLQGAFFKAICLSKFETELARDAHSPLYFLFSVLSPWQLGLDPFQTLKGFHSDREFKLSLFAHSATYYSPEFAFFIGRIWNSFQLQNKYF